MRKTRSSFKLLAGGLIPLMWALGSPSPARAGGIAPKLGQQIKAAPTSTQLDRVIVRFTTSGVNAGSLATSYCGKLAVSYTYFNGATMVIPQNALAGLSQNPNVAWISPDRKLRAHWDYAAQTIGADQVWSSPGATGTGVGVAVLDTGCVNGCADWCRSGTATSRIVGWKDLVNNQSTPYDDNGHGTHVAGIVLGSGNNSARLFTGVAPDANLVAVKVLDQTGSGSVSTVISGLDWCIGHRSALGIRVINLSLGCDPQESYTTDPLCIEVRKAVKAGIVVVCAAGNKGKNELGQTVYGGIESPGNEPSAITVGAENTHQTASRSDDTVDTYSSRGPTYLDQLAKPDLVAPGNKIVSVRAPGSYLDTTYPANQVAPSAYGASGAAQYFTLSGTSMATPEVTGVVALMLQVNPNLGPESAK